MNNTKTHFVPFGDGDEMGHFLFHLVTGTKRNIFYSPHTFPIILLLTLALLAGLVYLVYKYWDQVKNQFQGIKASQGDDPHTVDKKLKYLIEEENGLRENDPVEVGDDNRNFGNRLRENNNFGNGSRENDPIEVNNENSNGP